MKDFTQDDIRDKILLEELVRKEAEIIFNSPKARKKRSYDQIYASVKQGKIAELYLVETGKFKFSDLKWHDLVNSNGEICEIKSYNISDWNVSFVYDDIRRYRTEKWCQSTWYYLFSCIGGTYRLLSVMRIK